MSPFDPTLFPPNRDSVRCFRVSFSILKMTFCLILYSAKYVMYELLISHANTVMLTQDKLGENSATSKQYRMFYDNSGNNTPFFPDFPTVSRRSNRFSSPSCFRGKKSSHTCKWHTLCCLTTFCSKSSVRNFEPLAILI